MSPFAENKSDRQGPLLFHESETTERQTVIHMGAFMGNGTQTVVREPGKFQSAVWVQIFNEALCVYHVT